MVYQEVEPTWQKYDAGGVLWQGCPLTQYLAQADLKLNPPAWACKHSLTQPLEKAISTHDGSTPVT